ncbi:bifunctional 3-(3-hydroxy-phenyl)propionate/3-hydroxycinnamic acid hydroxylase [Streptomyces sp. NPDC026665]|uniref:bifunctional 3-(3-hydroxy-phenyl)propionate/3-hydroxycinnamic acid hydroxylase MhpA n=1 Tax=Streptomyces sp. NPDC026665 TaxID=3154798 RepID=UPI0033DEF8BC
MTPTDPPPATDVHADVVIVGAGPTGLISALLLADRGHSVALIERWPEPYALPRAVGISHETLRALQNARVIDDLAPQLLFSGDGSRVAEIRSAEGEVLGVRHDRATSPSGWPERASFCQPDLERTLDARIAEHPGTQVFRGWTAVHVASDDEEALVTAEPLTGAAAMDPSSGITGSHSSGDGHLRAHGRYVLGCDGANSVVRQAVGADTTDLGFAYDWLVVDVIPHDPHRTYVPHLGQILGPPRPTTLVMGGPGRRRWEFMRLDGETMQDLNRPETAWRLLAPFDVTPENATLERHAVYTFRGRWCESWNRGRVLLAGDAAHLMPPFLGEGFNSGVRDAVAVSWQLDLVLRRLADARLLDTYSAERLGHVRQTIEGAVELGRMICVTDPAEARRRDESLRAARDNAVAHTGVRQWRLGEGTWLADDPHAGYLGVQGRVRIGERTGRFDDLLGRGRFVLIGRDQDPEAFLTEELRERWKDLGGICAHIADSAPVADVDGTYANWFATKDVDLALLRPDFYVFGTARSVADAPQLISALLDRLASP